MTSHLLTSLSPGDVKEKMSSLSSQLQSSFNSITHDLPKPVDVLNIAKNLKSSSSVPAESKTVPEKKNSNSSGFSDYRLAQFEQILQTDNIDSTALRKLSWNGVPSKHRSLVWQILLGYAPTNRLRRQEILRKKRKEYLNMVNVYYDVPDEDRTAHELEIKRQILKDIPRTCPDSPFFQQGPIQLMMERILYVWSVRHPASGYVQGMDDLLTPMLYLSLSAHAPNQDVFRTDTQRLEKQILLDIEADSYWCFTKLLDNIQDHYTFSQPGLQRMLLRLEDLIVRLDSQLSSHFQAQSIQYIQFGFRWMNCLLLRELPFDCILRLWDTYISEQSGGFENFHVYVCAVVLKTFQPDLLQLNTYEDLLIFLQDLPTKDWKEEAMESILSQAFILSTLFDSSPSHLG